VGAVLGYKEAGGAHRGAVERGVGLAEGAAGGRDVRCENARAAHGAGDAGRAHARAELEDLKQKRRRLRPLEVT
jgi:hypothetical protein